MDEVRATARKLHLAGLGAGDKIGVRIPSGTNELYISILAVMLVGAAYVPVDADDPDERAKLVFGEARVAGILRAGGKIVTDSQTPAAVPSRQAARPRGRRLGDLHLRLHRHTQGRCGAAPLGRRVRGR